MSAFVHLYSHSTAEPSWFDYEEGDNLVFEANYLVPILWLALFSESNCLAWFDSEGDSDDPDKNRVPCLVGSKHECLHLLDKRHDYLTSFFSHCSNILIEFREKIDATVESYLSVEMSEVFYMEKDSDVFFQAVNDTLKMFDRMDHSATDALMYLADTKGYDSTICDYISAEPNDSMSYRYHAIGSTN